VPSPGRSLEKGPLVVQEETPLEIYENAILKERQGSLSEAVIQYRRAFKVRLLCIMVTQMDPDVDKHYKQKYFSAAATSNSAKSSSSHHEEIHSGYSTQEYRGTETSDGISSITNDLRALSIIQIEPEDPNKACHISSLPDELLLNILLHLSLSSLSSLLHVSLVCKKLYQLAQDENSLYKKLCIHYFTPFIPPVTLLSRSAEYNFDYRRMLIERPRLRFDGVYIATCHYLRPGVNDAAWNTPIHVVTYFRYVRFYPEGGCITVLTTLEPREVVHSVGWGTALKGTSDGVWRMSESGEVRVRVSGPRKYTFVKDLQVVLWIAADED
jgi:F-box protein 9